MMKGAQMGPMGGQISALISIAPHYALLAFTWMMGLMGYSDRRCSSSGMSAKSLRDEFTWA